MRKELEAAVAIGGLLALSTLGISVDVRRKVKDKRVDVLDKSQLEIHHIHEIWQGGNGDEENLVAVRKPEHALLHYKEARKARDKDTMSAEYWAVRAIVRRMKPEEIGEFNAMVNGRKKR
jgi:hypothetical protein